MARVSLNTCERAWAAGFFDGEGCTHVHTVGNGVTRNRYKLLRVQINQKDEEPLYRFQEAVGGYGAIYDRKNGLWNYSVGKQDDCHAVLDAIWPWLCSTKRLQANRSIEGAIGRVW